MKQACAMGQKGRLDMWDRKPDPAPASVHDFPHDLGCGLDGALSNVV